MISAKRIRVLIADDSEFFLNLLTAALSTDNTIEVVGTAQNADDAFKLVGELHPDILTLDVEMPGINGIEFLGRLLPVYPIPVIVVSSLPLGVFEALSHGAVDFVKKPSVSAQNAFKSFSAELKSKIKIGINAHVRPPKLGSSAKLSFSPTSANSAKIIAIGASTGGTDAVLRVVKNLPKNTPGIVVVQHMPAGFTEMFARQIDSKSLMSAAEARPGMRVRQGEIIVAAGDFHLTVHKDADGYFIKSRPGEKVSGHCPSVDVMFASAAEAGGADAVGILLTGMGADGAKGLLEIKKAGGYTIGQNQESCVVYGMPRVAKNIGAVVRELHLDQIPAQTLKVLGC